MLEALTGCKKAFLSQSATSALETAGIIVKIEKGDEVIMPSFTFPSTANAFALRGAKVVFADIRPDTLNIDEELIEPLITHRTKLIVVVHYAGVACNMTKIMATANKYGIKVIEDAAHALGGQFGGQPLGSLGHLAAFSFHQTKNISCGEGGALIINDEAYVKQAEIVRHFGTNRAAFQRGDAASYTWLQLGTHDMPGELSAAMLRAQLECLPSITAARQVVWQRYYDELEDLAVEKKVGLPGITERLHA